MQYTETQLAKLIEDVEKEFTAHLTKAEDTSAGVEGEALTKAEGSEKKPEKKPEPEAKPEGEAKPEPKPEEGKPEFKPEGEVKPEGGSEPEQEATPAIPAGQEQAGHDYDDEDLEHMRKMYMSMSQAELKAHHDVIASLAKCGDGMGKSEIEDENPTLNSHPTDKGSDLHPDKANGGIEGYQPHNAEGAKSPASNANGDKMKKSEHDRRNGGKIEDCAPGKTPGAKSPASKAEGVQMEKSENTELELLKSELTTATAKYDDLKKNFDAVASFLTKLVEKKGAPAAKAITSLDAIKKSEGAGGEGEKTFSKEEIHSILCKKSSEPTLQKSDREAINVYYDKGQVDVTGISHLLK